LIVVEFETIGDHSFDSDFAAVEVVDGTWEAEGLGEGADDLGWGASQLMKAEL
jgi:hypothetical protein